VNTVENIPIEKPAQLKVINIIPEKTVEVSSTNLKGFVRNVGIIFTAVYTLWFLMMFLLIV